MATDIPFWRRSTGAEQRMASMVQFLSQDNFLVRTFFLGQTGSEQFTPDDQAIIADLGLDVEQKSSDQPPSSFARKIGWYADAAMHHLKTITAGQQSEESSQESTPLRLNEFQWPWAVTAFEESVEKYKPDAILIQYVKLAYLLEGLSTSQAGNIKTFVDTHDVLHLRNQRFAQRGFKHWIDISRDEEADALSKFDCVIAIQPEEADVFKEMAPSAKVLVCGHAMIEAARDGTSKNLPAAYEQVQTSGQKISVGYLGSVNASNADAVTSLIDACALSQEAKENVRLVIAGAICEWITENEVDANAHVEIELLGRVDSLSDFYDQVDVVANPVEFGTGLKIKNVEAMAFGKPLFTTPHGMVGLPGISASKIFECANAFEIIEEVIALSKDEPRLIELIRNASKSEGAEIVAADSVYSELKSAMDDSSA